MPAIRRAKKVFHVHAFVRPDGVVVREKKHQCGACLPGEVKEFHARELPPGAAIVNQKVPLVGFHLGQDWLA